MGSCGAHSAEGVSLKNKKTEPTGDTHGEIAFIECVKPEADRNVG